MEPFGWLFNARFKELQQQKRNGITGNTKGHYYTAGTREDQPILKDALDLI
jgi:hypothetical protein